MVLMGVAPHFLAQSAELFFVVETFNALLLVLFNGAFDAYLIDANKVEKLCKSGASCRFIYPSNVGASKQI